MATGSTEYLYVKNSDIVKNQNILYLKEGDLLKTSFICSYNIDLILVPKKIKDEFLTSKLYKEIIQNLKETTGKIIYYE